MIETTMTHMEHRFKVELNGYLESESKYPNSYTPENFWVAFDQTITYLNQTEESLEALHNIVFHAHIKREDYETDFDVPRFGNGVTESHYLAIVHRYQLYGYTKRELWKCDAESAIKILFELYGERTQQVPELIKLFIPLSLDLEDREFHAKMDAWLAMISSYPAPDSLFTELIQEYYDCIMIAFENYDQQPSNGVEIRLRRLFDSLFKLIRVGGLLCNKEAVYAVVELAKEKYFYLDSTEILNDFPLHFEHEEFRLSSCEIQKKMVSYKPTGMQKTLREYLDLSEKDQEDNDHEHIFRVMEEYICLGGLPNQRDKAHPIPSDEDSAFDRLEQVIKQKYEERTMCGVKLKCIYIIRTRGMFWKSILKLVTQFLDLWISELEDADFINGFARLIVQENLMPFLYQHIKKHVRHYNLTDNATSMEMIKDLTLLMETCLNYVSTNHELLLFRDHVFESRNENDDIRLPTLGSTSFWNIPFDQEIVRVTNQITSFELDASVPEEITKRLIILSIIWPYEVVRQLFLSCVQNKNQSMATIPVLYNLGNLCAFRKKDDKKETLLVLVLTDTISLNNSELVGTYMENISQFIKSCCYHKVKQIL
ncbi:uncharacterized protein EV154DRAFT_201593 [Mucor mucedo]|uniref:uncharacterized protein n=1 Tax=Mucor mucedo TaxID=29922 RepID=UPI0022205EFB|nr:uncharacterized protein EV154DRAFT_201593 [Mucor mucedo]KAI7892214.1 hypothetical protein EV154DRAFT_201593 [Mucor mucedo]